MGRISSFEHQRDRQEDVPAVQAEVVQPEPSSDTSDDRKTLSGSCASKSFEKTKDKSTTRAKRYNISGFRGS